MEWVELDSSLLRAARYDLATRRLALKFQKGVIYYYLDVPVEVYQTLLTTSSPGAYFVEAIRDAYTYFVARS